MVVVTFDYRDMLSLLGKEVTLEELVDTIPTIGAEHEGVVDETIRVNIFPNRPDMYSVEGIARALRGITGVEEGLPSFDLKVSGIDFLVDKTVKKVRPYAVGGLVKGLRLTEDQLISIVELQERLTTTLGRRRKKVAIGLHDNDTVEPPYLYKAFRPEEMSFVPLGGSEEMTLGQILRDHKKGKEYGWILEGESLLPLILDGKQRVLSFPPIINGDVTALTPKTKNMFIDVTGTDFQAVSSALNIMMTALAERDGELNSVTIYREDEALETPNLQPFSRDISLRRTNDLLGLELTPGDAITCLRRMRLDAVAERDTIHVTIPAYRTDVLHEVDLIEDVAIGYGFGRFEGILPKWMTIGEPSPLNEFTGVVKEIMIGHGLQEVRTLTFQSSEDRYKASADRISILNPLSSDFDTVRSSLLPSILEILRLNRRRDLPQRFFEVDDVVIGGRNRRHVAGAITHPKTGFTEVKGLVQGIIRDLGLTVDIEEEVDENFLEGRCARPLIGSSSVGHFGELRPEVIVAYELTNPVTAFELDVQRLFDAYRLRTH